MLLWVAGRSREKCYETSACMAREGPQNILKKTCKMLHLCKQKKTTKNVDVQTGNLAENLRPETGEKVND